MSGRHFEVGDNSPDTEVCGAETATTPKPATSSLLPLLVDVCVVIEMYNRSRRNGVWLVEVSHPLAFIHLGI